MPAFRRSTRAAARLVIEEVGERSARVRLLHHERHTRPGGTVSGPAMFTLADIARLRRDHGSVG